MFSGDHSGAVELLLETDAVLQTEKPMATLSMEIGARKTETFSINVLDGAQTSDAMIRIAADAGDELTDTVQRSVRVVPRGFPFTITSSGTLDASTNVGLELPDALIAGSASGRLQILPSPQSQLSAGMESILREPHGCFEQTSASNYPNVLAFHLMNLDGVVDKSMRLRTESLLRRGYRKLAQYECKSGGFEWFGIDPGHEALTAFGLMQFAEMSHFINVDNKMMVRTRDWLLSRRDGKGGFHRNPRHLHSWAVDHTVNAFVVWTLSETGRSLGGTWKMAAELARELDRVQSVAEKSDDGYLIALSAAALWNSDRNLDAQKLMNRLAGLQQSDGSITGKQTVTQSGGISRTVETTALAVLCWASSEAHHRYAVDSVNWLMKNRRGGGFGSTQATVLALKAISATHELMTGADGGDVRVLADGEVIDRIRWQGRPQEGVTWMMPEKLTRQMESDSSIKLTLKSAQGIALPYTVEIRGNTDAPRSDDQCVIDLEVQFAERPDSKIRAGESIEVVATVRNKAAVGQPMTLAVVGLPGGTEPVIESLDKLRDSGEIDFYELRGRDVVLYWRTLAPNERKRIRFPVIAQVPGRYTAPPSRAYLYYTAEHKRWTAPLVAEIGG